MPDVAALNLRDIARALGGEVSGNQVKAPGPNHSRKDRSLSVWLDPSAPDGFAVHSFSTDDPIICRDYVRERCGAPAFAPTRPNGRSRRPGNVAAQARVKKAIAAHNAKGASKRKVVAIYEYRDADGVLLYTKKRFEPKDFRQYAADGTSGLKGISQSLYRLPQLIAAVDATIYVCEGEKDASRVADLGLIATSADSGTWEKPGLITPLRNRDVIILPDNDAKGRKRALEAAHALHGVAASIRVVPLSGLADGEDVSDWLDRNPTNADAFKAMCLQAPLWVPGAERSTEGDRDDEGGVQLDDFYAYMPQHAYIFAPSREMWPAVSVNAKIPPVPAPDGTPVRASQWLDNNRGVTQMTWWPGQPLEIRDRIISEGGWIEREGVTVFNLYRPPTVKYGNAADASRWVDHVSKVYPDYADHIINWLAHRVQHPGDKINHALVLGGAQGIGKDTLLAPVKQAVGPWNFNEVSPQNTLGRFNSFLKSVILRVNEARDLGEINRFSFYEHMKAYTAAPPDVLRVDEKNLREYSVLNCVGVILTTNHKANGVYLPADDRRHFVAWSDLTGDSFEDGYWDALWGWYDKGGDSNVAAFLKERDISEFNAKAPPPKTDGFWQIVDASAAPEDAELADALDTLGNPAATTLERVRHVGSAEFIIWANDRKNRRLIPYRFERCGYAPIRNPTAADGMWKINRRRHTVYARNELSIQQKINAARKLADEQPQPLKVVR